MFDEVEVQIKEAEAALKELSGEWDMAGMEAGVSTSDLPDDEKPLFENLFDKKAVETSPSRGESWKEVVTVSASGSSCGSPGLSPRTDATVPDEEKVAVSQDKEGCEAEDAAHTVDEGECMPGACIRAMDCASVAEEESLEQHESRQESPQATDPRLPSSQASVAEALGEERSQREEKKFSDTEMESVVGGDFADLSVDGNQLMEGMSCSSSLMSDPGSPASGGASGEFSLATILRSLSRMRVPAIVEEQRSLCQVRV